MKIKLGFIILFCILAVSLTAQPARSDSIVRVGACRPLGWPWGVFVQSDFAYVATRSYLSIVDISAPPSPWVVINFDEGSGPLGVFVIDTLAYINDGGWFTIVNVSTPDSPSIVGSCFIPVVTEPKGVYVRDSNAYLAASDSGLQIVSVLNPSTPSIIGRHHTPGKTKDLFVNNLIAYLADLDSLQIIEVSDSTAPFRLGAVAMPNSCYDVFVIDTFAYVACQSNFGTDGTLQIVNVSDPTVPFIINSVTMNGDPLAVCVSGSYAYVAAADWWSSDKGPRQVGGLRPKYASYKRADVEGGLRVVNISDPLTPTLVASYDTPGDPRGVFAIDTLVFVADYDSLQILKHIVVGVKEKEIREIEVSDLGGLNVYPNPFNASTSICYQLTDFEFSTLK
ncbi:MAG: hypothetical protein E3J87_01440, partial [Candidatus Cloacimonadota bacterium]